MNKCLVCGGDIKMRCKCFMSDTTCENGHEYHYSTKDNEWHLGRGNHGQGECCEEKVIIKVNNEKEN